MSNAAKLFIFSLLGAALSFLPSIIASTQVLDTSLLSVETYAPNLWFASTEEYFPTDPLKFYYDANLNELNGEEARKKYNNLSREEKLANLAVFYHIDPLSNSQEIVYQYWLFYVFNDGKNEHYGDWEFVFVYVDKNSKEITKVIGSFHLGGATNTGVLESNKLKDVQHPWNYVAKGSHANCPDFEPDGQCNQVRWNAGEDGWSKTKSSYNPKVSFDDPSYSLVSLDSIKELIENQSNQKNLFSEKKSPALGSIPLKIFGIKFYTLPIFGEPPQDAWDRAEYSNSNVAQPITKELVADKTKEGIDYAAKQTQAVAKKAQNTTIKALIAAKNQVEKGIKVVTKQTQAIAKKTKNTTTATLSAVEHQTAKVIRAITKEIDKLSANLKIELKNPLQSLNDLGANIANLENTTAQPKEDLLVPQTESAANPTPDPVAIITDPEPLPSTTEPPQPLLIPNPDQQERKENLLSILHQYKDALEKIQGELDTIKTNSSNQVILTATATIEPPDENVEARLPEQSFFVSNWIPSSSNPSALDTTPAEDISPEPETPVQEEEIPEIIPEELPANDEEPDTPEPSPIIPDPSPTPIEENPEEEPIETPKEIELPAQDQESNPYNSSLPLAKFSWADETQPDPVFWLFWDIEKPAGIATPSDIDGISLWYSAADSSDENNNLLQYREFTNKGWDEWHAGNDKPISLSAESSGIQLKTLADNRNYTFYVQTKDATGKTSIPNTLSTATAFKDYTGRVVINEIAWMGTKADPNDEWIELFDIGQGRPINMTDWRLVIGEGEDTTVIPLVNFMQSNGFSTLERTDNNALADILSQIYKGGLNNSGEIIRLYDARNMLIDEVDARERWFAGKNEKDERGEWLRASMERIDVASAGSDPANWATNNITNRFGKDAKKNNINGTPQRPNSVSAKETHITSSTTSLRFAEFDTVVLTELGSPYYTNLDIVIPQGKTLIIEPGATLAFYNKIQRPEIRVEGTLIAIGTPEKPVTLSYYTPADSNKLTWRWCGIHFTPTSKNSRLEFFTLKHSSYEKNSCRQKHETPAGYGIWAEKTDITIKNSLFTEMTATAIYLEESNSIIENTTFLIENNNGSMNGPHVAGGNPTIKNNTFARTFWPVSLDYGNMIFENNTITENKYEAIVLRTHYPKTDSNLPLYSLPYMVLDGFSVAPNTTLTIESGVTIKFTNYGSQNSQFSVEGTLISQGTEENPVIFTPMDETSSWRGIYFSHRSQNSKLEHTIIRQGGSTANGGAIWVDKSQVDLQDVIIEKSQSAGIRSDEGIITGANVTLRENAHDLHVTGNKCPEVSYTGPITLHPESILCGLLQELSEPSVSPEIPAETPLAELEE
ncbi:MAG: right-handed parallel beta-helix repeat-containing protein [Candidatus Wildermuthbacteria bacterium]|nr:right-handed parallel beta-helix repeat-containing protein [Candidatus Wildermuthbacteria bacterium]